MSRAYPGFTLDRYVIRQPSASDRIPGKIANGAGSEASSTGSDRAGNPADREEPVFQLGLLRWAQAKLYADRREADRIIPEPRLHRLFIGRKA